MKKFDGIPAGQSLIFLLIISLSACTGNDFSGRNITRDSLIKNAPVLSPAEFLTFTHIESGFEMQTVASEPDIIAPVSMIFDNKSRIWAVEMTNYMLDTEGDGEDVRDGRIVILEDGNDDGYYEKRTVFLDSLRLPRSIAFAGNGLLVVAPPNLWYYEIQEDKPGRKTLIDSNYTEGDNVEAQANGLFRGMDNWIYNAGSSKRYKKTDTGWITQRTHRRGQWGITQDDDGRLYYNNNSQNLLGDYFLPGLGSGNPNLTKMAGFNERIVKDNRTYPSRPTPGVNRGYLKSEVDDSMRLKKFTAACGPVLYRSDLFDTGYYLNAFVAEPAGNLIKRNILHFDLNTTTGEQAYEGKEFIASDDERFRPVNLYNGPDGALYIVDMYRGIIQYKLMITKYLKDEIRQRDLEKPVSCGRIYRVVPKGTKFKRFVMPESPAELVELLKNENSWKRERAQQILVDNKPAEIIPLLKKKLQDPQNFFEFIHSLWTLKGMEAISDSELVNQIMGEKDSRKLIQLYTAIDNLPDGRQKDEFISKTEELIKDSVLAPYLALKSYLFRGYGEAAFKSFEIKLLTAHPHSQAIAQAIISNSPEEETGLEKYLKNNHLDKQSVVFDELAKVANFIKESKNAGNSDLLRKRYSRGIGLFKTTCQPCHGSDGEGIKNLAPPLNNSEWVTGKKENLISIVLYGLTGPVEVNNKTYEVPEVGSEMPGVLNNPEMVESDLALLLSYIRNNWNNKASDVKLEDIKSVKNKWGTRANPFTIEELLKGGNGK